jgi:hypothetical protein
MGNNRSPTIHIINVKKILDVVIPFIPIFVNTVSQLVDTYTWGHVRAVLFNNFTLTHWLITQVTNITEQSSQGTNSSTASQEIPLNVMDHYDVHNRLPLTSIMWETHKLHIISASFFEIYFNIIHHSMPRFPKRTLFFRYSHQHIRIPLLFLMLHTHTPPILPYLIWQSYQYLAGKTKLEAPDCARFIVYSFYFVTSYILHFL